MSLTVADIEDEEHKTNDDDDNTEPPQAFSQRPDTIAEENLDSERDKCIHCRDINRRKPRFLEPFKVSKSDHEPVIDIGTS